MRRYTAGVLRQQLPAMVLAGLTLVIGLAGAAPAFADSLWSDTSPANLYIDRRPNFIIGGLVTIVVNERLQSSLDARTQGNKQVQNDHKFQIPDFGALFGQPSATGAPGAQNLKLTNQTLFNGSGTTMRNGTLNFEITAQIDDILPNGNLIISARKQTRINDELTDFVISGEIRRDDVDPNNRVPSTQVANMKIDVKGTGPVSAKATGGILSRLFNFLL
ncbi:MAG: flagellar basal body L-ring protein FlgH [Candidatus Sericytochromatia bacterium]|nr:flagellar basal body L-ring protein FlgH [Candidatus Sericytochromatia bacterium]